MGTFTGGISDPDGAPARGIAVLGTDESHGTWHYSLDNGATWQAVGTVDAGQSR